MLEKTRQTLQQQMKELRDNYENNLKEHSNRISELENLYLGKFILYIN